MKFRRDRHIRSRVKYARRIVVYEEQLWGTTERLFTFHHSLRHSSSASIDWKGVIDRWKSSLRNPNRNAITFSNNSIQSMPIGNLKFPSKMWNFTFYKVCNESSVENFDIRGRSCTMIPWSIKTFPLLRVETIVLQIQDVGFFVKILSKNSKENFPKIRWILMRVFSHFW